MTAPGHGSAPRSEDPSSRPDSGQDASNTPAGKPPSSPTPSDPTPTSASASTPGPGGTSTPGGTHGPGPLSGQGPRGARGDGQSPREQGGSGGDSSPRGNTAPRSSSDIEGALGRIKVGEEQHHSGVRRRLITFLAIFGPGLIVMVGDNDAGGISTYAQAGQDYGYSLLWTLLLLIPVLIVNQEMVVRLGAVTGVGHARLINERFGRFWGWFSVGDLFALNFLTIVTEFIGVSLALRYFGVSSYISVPVTAVLLVAITASGSFRRWEQAMFGFIAVSLLLLPLALLSHPHYGGIFYHFVVPGVRGGFSSDAVLLIIAIVGTTVAPWQLFFQQSNVIDKRITPRFISYERADTTLGAFVVVAGATAVLVVAEFAARSAHLAGHFTDALGVARALDRQSGVLAGLFSIVLLDASIIGAAAVTLSTSYAFGDVFGISHSLHRKFRDAKSFYASYGAMIAIAATIVLIPGTPLGLLTTAVQALAGILLPSASVFLLLLCNDREVLGPWVNPRWLNILATFIIGVLVMLSGTLVVTTLFSHLNAAKTALWITVALAGSGMLVGSWLLVSSSRRPARPPHPRQTLSDAERLSWRMPPLALLKPVEWSAVTKLSMLLLRGYLVISVLLLIVKAVRVGSG